MYPASRLLVLIYAHTSNNVRYHSSDTTARRSYELFRRKTLYMLITLLMKPYVSVFPRKKATYLAAFKMLLEHVAATSGVHAVASIPSM